MGLMPRCPWPPRTRQGSRRPGLPRCFTSLLHSRLVLFVLPLSWEDRASRARVEVEPHRQAIVLLTARRELLQVEVVDILLAPQPDHLLLRISAQLLLDQRVDLAPDTAALREDMSTMF